MEFIEVTEHGTEIKKSLVKDKIKMLEHIDFKNGQKATIISFIDGTEIFVKESLARVKSLLS